MNIFIIIFFSKSPPLKMYPSLKNIYQVLSIVCSTNTYTTPCSSICYHIFQINLLNSDHSILTGKKLFRKKNKACTDKICHLMIKKSENEK